MVAALIIQEYHKRVSIFVFNRNNEVMKRPYSFLSVFVVGVLTFGVFHYGLNGSDIRAYAADSNSSQILPVPQKLSSSAVVVPLSGVVAVVGNGMSDPATAESVKELIQAAGGTNAPTGTAARIIAGTLGDPIVADALKKAKIENAASLAANGYVLTTAIVDNVPTLIIEGKDAAGTYYGVQTARQMLKDKVISGTIRDWPSMSIRGVIEGFYGQPWSHQARLDMLKFSAEHKMNTYIYTPKDDRYLRSEWRTLYPDAEIAKIREIVDQANRYHLDFVFALSPGNDICYSKIEDYEATIKKFEQLRKIGVHSFYIALDDIEPTLKCSADKAAFPSRGPWTQLADAQSYYLNKIQKEWIVPNKVNPLMMVPTNYNGSKPDPFKTAQGERLDQDIRMQWTGEGVFSQEVSRASVDRALKTYNTHHMFIWDNFPVNDGDRNRLFLQPLFGRDKTLHEVLDGFTSNPMIQPYASWIALQGFADYTWNTPNFDAEASQKAILRELAGNDMKVRESLDAFVDLNQFWETHDPNSKRAPQLSLELADYEKYLNENGVISNNASFAAAKAQIKKRLDIISQAPGTIKAMAVTGFYKDAEPWIKAASEWAKAALKALEVREAAQCTDLKMAGDAYVEMLKRVVAARQPAVDDMDSNFVLKAKSIIPKVGDGKFEEIVGAAKTALEKLLKLQPVDIGAKPTVKSDYGHYEKYVAENMLDGNVDTIYWSNANQEAGKGVQVDLQSAKAVSALVFQQGKSDNDTGGDIATTIVVKSSVDGKTWDEIGKYNNLAKIEIKLTQPKEMRYIRFEPAQNVNKWWQIREIIFAISDGMPVTTNLPLQINAQLPIAFDANLNTSMIATGVPEKGGHVTYLPPTPQNVKSVVLLGNVKGKVQIKQSNGDWSDLGAVSADKSMYTWAITEGEVTGLRLLVDPDSPAPTLTEFGLRADALPESKCASVIPPTPKPVEYKPALTVPVQAAPGQTVTISGTGFAPKQQLMLSLIPTTMDNGKRSPVLTQKLTAGADGAFQINLALPATLLAGAYMVEVRGSEPNIVLVKPLQLITAANSGTTIPKVPAVPKKMPATGVNMVPFGLLASLCIVGGIFLRLRKKC